MNRSLPNKYKFIMSFKIAVLSCLWLPAAAAAAAGNSSMKHRNVLCLLSNAIKIETILIYWLKNGAKKKTKFKHAFSQGLDTHTTDMPRKWAFCAITNQGIQNRQKSIENTSLAIYGFVAQQQHKEELLLHVNSKHQQCNEWLK